MAREAISIRYIGETGHPFCFTVGKNCDRIEVTTFATEPYCEIPQVTVYRDGAPVFTATLQKIEHVFFQEPNNGDQVGKS